MAQAGATVLPPGARAARWSHGGRVPAASVGADGDQYLVRTDGSGFVRVGGVWVPAPSTRELYAKVGGAWVRADDSPDAPLLDAWSEGAVAVAGVESSCSRPVNVLRFKADPSGVVDSFAAFARALEYAVAIGARVVYVPPGMYWLSQMLLMPEGCLLRGDNRFTTFLDFRVVAGTDGLAWSGPVDGPLYGNEGGIEGITVQSSTQTARDLISIVKWNGWEGRRFRVYGAQRFGVHVSNSMDVTIHRGYLCGLWDGACRGVSGLHVDRLSTTVDVYKTYINLWAEGPGADTVATSFWGCIVESNGGNHNYTTYGEQDPMLGAGIRIREGWAVIAGGHLENNAGHAIIVGTDASATVTIATPAISGDTLNFTQPTAAAVWAAKAIGGDWLGLRVWMPRSVVFTDEGYGVHLGGMRSYDGHFVTPPEYLGEGSYRGVIEAQEPVTGAQYLAVEELRIGATAVDEATLQALLALVAP